ncbi:AraC family transcriptional regulator [Microbacterium barkeri]|uniref:AraC family transcriptional regulator n=1 Tax=Microbacterium barkeri TaxID=33917 RepID=UPI0022F2828A|nr:AraC family transcriptional regulator [Microbacterium barkeri]MDI6942534.1 AraC family transcriptional regulator [Microbacterium barkeri]MDR6875307.1 AraC-like DNA-binding protein [Microbacterium barkeri]
MDMMSEVVAVLRRGRPRSQRVTWTAPWGQRFAAVEGSAGFQVILRGTCWLLRDAEEPIRLQTGDVLFLPSGVEHALADRVDAELAEACEPGRVTGNGAVDIPANPDHGIPGEQTVTLCGAYELDLRFIHPLLAQLPPVVILRAPFDRGEPLRDAVELLAMELDRPGPGTDHLVAALLDVLFIHILRACHDERILPDSAHSWVTAIRDTGISSALDAFHDNPGHPWTVAELAQRAVMSRTAFARRFHELIGDPPMTYITWWRMNLAAALLTDTDQSMRAIAQRVGYSSEYAFAHAFRRERGVSPGAARRAGRRGGLPDTGKPPEEGDTA